MPSSDWPCANAILSGNRKLRFDEKALLNEVIQVF